MDSQRSHSRVSRGARGLPASVLFAAALLLPADGLLCLFCPLQRKGQPCPSVTSQCLPDQRCSNSRGRYGSLHVLSARGCVGAELCGSHEIAAYRGVKYNVSHSCCCEDGCNGRPGSGNAPKLLMGMLAVRRGGANGTNVLREELWDSCANSTSGSFT
ncbi:uncharacterized protein ACO6RY_10384 [Pungitius sinensis]